MDPDQQQSPPERPAAGPPEQLLTSIMMAAVALVSNSVKPSNEEVRSNIERFGQPYFRAFVDHCLQRVYGRRP